ncbi:hypothetical protein B0T25DRAFT_112865 [Lasiosphaeria hispida]|uniref:Uncharacterized protein n=1 Tax=Lasiosphaeria hispida TaxID=260671 RepID=A0AAJ0MI75_9PEZI|nr:hypothetical protein B0T25DRAFT_112865 [Lasiosphaeria hispida]
MFKQAIVISRRACLWLPCLPTTTIFFVFFLFHHLLHHSLLRQGKIEHPDPSSSAPPLPAVLIVGCSISFLRRNGCAMLLRELPSSVLKYQYLFSHLQWCKRGGRPALFGSGKDPIEDRFLFGNGSSHFLWEWHDVARCAEMGGELMPSSGVFFVKDVGYRPWGITWRFYIYILIHPYSRPFSGGACGLLEQHGRAFVMIFARIAMEQGRRLYLGFWTAAGISFPFLSCWKMAWFFRGRCCEPFHCRYRYLETTFWICAEHPSDPTTVGEIILVKSNSSLFAISVV